MHFPLCTRTWSYLILFGQGKGYWAVAGGVGWSTEVLWWPEMAGVGRDSKAEQSSNSCCPAAGKKMLLLVAAVDGPSGGEGRWWCCGVGVAQLRAGGSHQLWLTQLGEGLGAATGLPGQP
uniref:Uncharacterized protein n=1 Tax=Opuntia streptacantha TaxID=393608 RepID=A0A7C9CJ61_OPUST